MSPVNTIAIRADRFSVRAALSKYQPPPNQGTRMTNALNAEAMVVLARRDP